MHMLKKITLFFQFISKIEISHYSRNFVNFVKERAKFRDFFQLARFLLFFRVIFKLNDFFSHSFPPRIYPVLNDSPYRTVVAAAAWSPQHETRAVFPSDEGEGGNTESGGVGAPRGGDVGDGTCCAGGAGAGREDCRLKTEDTRYKSVLFKFH